MTGVKTTVVSVVSLFRNQQTFLREFGDGSSVVTVFGFLPQFRMQVENVKFKHRENIEPLKASSQDRLSSKLSNGAVKKIVSSISISTKAHEQ